MAHRLEIQCHRLKNLFCGFIGAACLVNHDEALEDLTPWKDGMRNRRESLGLEGLVFARLPN